MEAGFVVYIDEAGDDNLKRVRPFFPNGASEWFVLSGAVVRLENDPKVSDWQRTCLNITGSKQRSDIHFRHLSEHKKRMVCSEAAKLDARYFVVMSNKKNMMGRRNPNLSAGRHYLYWWMSRLLLERVSSFCGAWSRKHHKTRKSMEIIFSKRDDKDYAEFIDYLIKLQIQSENQRLVLDYDIDWSVVDVGRIHAIPHSQRPGLQLADVVASAFYQSVTPLRGSCDTSAAKALRPRMHKRGKASAKGGYIGIGVKTMPSIPEMELTEAQRAVFAIYDYKGGW